MRKRQATGVARVMPRPYALRLRCGYVDGKARERYYQRLIRNKKKGKLR